MRVLKSMFIWLLILVVVFASGVLRDFAITPLIGEQISRPLSGLIACIAIIIITYILLPKLGNGTVLEYVLMGLLWVVMANIFDLSMYFWYSGLADVPWTDFFKMFDIRTGDLWLIVMVVCFITPIVVAKKRNLVA
jgi:hypothetical protein